jgi:hypothetical protein
MSIADLAVDEQCGCPREGGHTYHAFDCSERPCACSDPVEGAYRSTDDDCSACGGW